MTFVSALRRSPGKHPRKQKDACFSIRGRMAASKGGFRGAARRGPLRPVATVENRGFPLAPMQKAAKSPLLCAFCCFPPASPALRCGAGKQKAAPKDALCP